MTTETSKVGYQFTPMPKQLTHLLDVNLRSMLFSLIDISNYFADEDGWFFRTNDQLHLDSDLSKNLVIATIDTLFQHSLVDVSCSGTGSGKQPNNYRLNLDSFKFFEQLDLNTDIHRPENKIETVKYNVKGYHATYLDDQPVRYIPELVKGKITWNPVNPTGTSTTDDTTVPTTEPTTNVTKIEHNIDNIYSIYNKEYINNIYNKDYIENVNKDYINTNNDILKEKLDNGKEKLEKKKEEGMTEPNSKNENEGKTNPIESQLNNKKPSGEDQDCIPGEVEDGETYVDSPSQPQLTEEAPKRQDDSNISTYSDTNTEKPEPTKVEEPRPNSHRELQDYFLKRFKQEFKDRIPESENDIQQSKEKLYQELEKFSFVRDYRLVGYMINDACRKETDRLLERIVSTK